MATAAFPARRRHAFASRAAGWARSAAAAALAPHKAALGNLRDIPLTVAGLGSVDFAAFHLAHGWGWLVTGVSLMFLEHLIADEK